MSATGTEVDLWQQAYDQLAPEVRERWELDQVRTIRNTVAQDLSPAEFQMGLAIAAHYDLDPLLKEIWFAKSQPRDGKPGRVMIMVGRDGLLRNARRDPAYRGFAADVVRENDEFEVEHVFDGERWTVAKMRHKYGKPKDRGEIVGAWAVVTQDGKLPTYFFAPWTEYVPRDLNKAPTWKTQPSVMIQKCALSLCLRLAFNLSGVVGEDEGARAFEAEAAAIEPEPGAEEVLRYVPEDLRERFEVAWDKSQVALPGRFTPAAVQMSIVGQPRERIEAYLREMEEAVEGLVEADVVEEDEPIRATNHSEAEVERLAEVMGDEDPRSISEITQDEADSIDAAEARAENLGGGDDGPADEDPPGSGGELSAEPEQGQAGEESPAPAAQEEDLEALRHRLSDLYDRRMEIEENPSDTIETESALDEIGVEIEWVEDQIRDAGGQVPGQESLGL
jgi:phage recombination protein Bet